MQGEKCTQTKDPGPNPLQIQQISIVSRTTRHGSTLFLRLLLWASSLSPSNLILRPGFIIALTQISTRTSYRYSGGTPYHGNQGKKKESGHDRAKCSSEVRHPCRRRRLSNAADIVLELQYGSRRVEFIPGSRGYELLGGCMGGLVWCNGCGWRRDDSLKSWI